MSDKHFIAYRNFRYLKLAGLLSALAILGYWLAIPAGGSAYGGTVFGYVLGIASTIIVLLHLAYAFARRMPRKYHNRRTGDRRKLFAGKLRSTENHRRAEERRRTTGDSWRYGGTLQGWLSAHVHLGLALLVFATLHTGFRFGWNVHTLAYGLLLLVIATGLLGAYLYLHIPRQLARNGSDGGSNDIAPQLDGIDQQLRTAALGLPETIRNLLDTAARETRIEGSLIEKLTGGQRNCPTRIAALRVRALGSEVIDSEQSQQIRDVYAILLRKQRLLDGTREHVRLMTTLRLWLVFHGPLSIGLLAALLAHVLTIFIYW